MLTTLGIVLSWLLAAPPLAALTWFAIEVASGLPRLRPRVLRAADRADAAELVILIPAHDEENGIGGTLRHVLQDTGLHGRVLVVADNCQDNTAQVARDAGARVIERSDAARRGKGYALAFGRDHLASQAQAEKQDVVLVLDADCRMDADSIALLAREAYRLQAPVQARNLLRSDPSTSPLAQISNFAMLIKNLVRARGLYRLGGGIPLFGTGMAFPWAIFRDADLATDAVVEDMRLALELARDGVPVHLCEGARVESDPAADRDMQAQRSRWEHGFIATARNEALPLLANGVRSLSRHRAALGMHLLVPPLALLIMVSASLMILVGLLCWLAGDWSAAIALAIALAVALTLVFVAWMKEGRAVLYPAAAWRAPLYVLWKIPVYLGFFRERQTQWNRTRRQGE